MQCKGCKRIIPANSIYCNWCGMMQIQTDERKGLPVPHKTKSGYSAQMMLQGVRVTVKGKTEAEYYDNALKIKNGDFDLVSTKTLAECITEYISSRKSRIKQTTIEQYESIRDDRFPDLMQMKLLDITSRDIDRAIENELKRKSRKGGTISARTVNDAYHLVNTVIYKYTGKKMRADLPEVQRKFRTMPEPEQIYNAVKGTDIECPVLLAMWLGMSASEIRGLTKSKSLRGNKLYIVETVVDTKEGAIRKPGAKEPSRVRCYDVPDYILELINNIPDDIIEKRTVHALYSRLNHELNKHEIPAMRFHDLRHVNTSVMAMLNVPMVVQQARNGWSSDSMPKRVYSHVFDSERLQADNNINAYFNNIISNNVNDNVQ